MHVFTFPNGHSVTIELHIGKSLLSESFFLIVIDLFRCNSLYMIARTWFHAWIKFPIYISLSFQDCRSLFKIASRRAVLASSRPCVAAFPSSEGRDPGRIARSAAETRGIVSRKSHRGEDLVARSTLHPRYDL
jgi:hypothetical protein